ncbi:MAG: delta-60 repeat domain-containing protein, partial [Chthoniobacterales bacterium]
MKSIIPRIAAVSILFGIFAAGMMAFTLTRSATNSPGRPLAQEPSGVIETDGTLDSTFNSGKITNGLVSASVLQADGKLIIAGQFSEVHGGPRPSIARLNVDGTLDLSLDPGAGPDNGASHIALQADGKIIIVGFFQNVNGVARSGIARLNSDGSLDTGYDPGAVISANGTGAGGGSIYDMLLQPDGKLVVFGQFFFIMTGPGTSVPRSCIARFNSDGTFDPSYNPGAGAAHSVGTFNTFVYHAARQNLAGNAGKIIISGVFDSFDGHPVPGLARMNADGSFDATFTPGTAVDPAKGSISGLFVQADDQILAFGYFDSFSGVARHSIVRLNASTGVVDNGFSTEEFEGYNYDGLINGMAQQPDGKLIAVGEFHTVGVATANNVARLQTNGALDPSFSETGAGVSAWQINTALVRPSDGKVFLGGYFSDFGGQVRQNMAWANPDGSADNSFAGLGGVTEYEPNIWTVATQADGKVIMTGVFTTCDGVPHNNVLRVNSDGTVDSSFDVHTDRSTRALLIQPDGKILIAGFFGEVNGVPMPRIARLNPNGTLDPSFNPGSGPDQYYIRALALDSAGNIYVGGEFSAFNGIPHVGVVKLTPTGAVDNVFNPANAGPFDL